MRAATVLIRHSRILFSHTLDIDRSALRTRSPGTEPFLDSHNQFPNAVTDMSSIANELIVEAWTFVSALVVTSVNQDRP